EEGMRKSCGDRRKLAEAKVTLITPRN
ncbi:hypothetical protein CCACVL1_04668, partial [Corchorus capsularis]